jgi:hypothetical protein
VQLIANDSVDQPVMFALRAQTFTFAMKMLRVDM